MIHLLVLIAYNDYLGYVRHVFLAFNSAIYDVTSFQSSNYDRRIPVAYFSTIMKRSSASLQKRSAGSSLDGVSCGMIGFCDHSIDGSFRLQLRDLMILSQ